MPNATRSAQITTPKSSLEVLGNLVLNAGAPTGISVTCEMTGGVGGGTITAFVQSSLDGGTTWFDVMAFAFATSPRLLGLVSRSDVAISAGLVLTLNTLAPGANGAAINAPLGDQFRFGYISTGTYSNTKLNFNYSLTY